MMMNELETAMKIEVGDSPQNLVQHNGKGRAANKATINHQEVRRLSSMLPVDCFNNNHTNLYLCLCVCVCELCIWPA